MVKVDIISGFLGAGKTTLIQKLLKTVYKNQNIVLIENEFGEIGIDGGFLKEAGIEIKEMNSGCICCSLVGDFSASLKEVVETYHPERIIIEPSGVGKLSDVMRAVEGVKDEAGLEIGYRITVLDVNKCKMYLKNFGEFYVNQIEYASTVVFSRTDIAKEGKTEAALAVVKEHNSEAAVVTTPVEQLDEESLLAALNHTTGLEEMLKKPRRNMQSMNIITMKTMSMNITMKTMSIIMSTINIAMQSMNIIMTNMNIITIIMPMISLQVGAQKLVMHILRID